MGKKVDIEKMFYAKPTLAELGKMQIVTKDNKKSSAIDASINAPIHLGDNRP